ncbi:MAG: chemotaxis protein CheW [Desulfobacterales bacterium]|nr:chemotaxis protein CheW [Desulfobacterales bacterium]MBF0395856.1 chemotaxis protein CheW [Desulfobacterales bacterium]
MEEKNIEEELSETVSIVIFRIQKEWLALPSIVLEKIIDAKNCTKLLHTIPHSKNPVLKGIINICGEIRLYVSLEKLLVLDYSNEENKTNHIYKRIMIINKNNNYFAFPVDEIHGIYRVDINSLQNMPDSVVKSKKSFTKTMFKWDEKLVSFLDEELLFYSLSKIKIKNYEF